MNDYHDWALDVLEQAEHDAPFCRCGAHNVLVADDDHGVWLQCAELRRPASPWRRLVATGVPGGHDRRHVLQR